MASRPAQLLPEIVDQQRHERCVGEAAEVDRAGVEHLGAATGLVVGHLGRATRAEDVRHPCELHRSLWRLGGTSVDLDSVATGNHAAVVEAAAPEQPWRACGAGDDIGLVPVEVTIPIEVLRADQRGFGTAEVTEPPAADESTSVTFDL